MREIDVLFCQRIDHTGWWQILLWWMQEEFLFQFLHLFHDQAIIHMISLIKTWDLQLRFKNFSEITYLKLSDEICYNVSQKPIKREEFWKQKQNKHFEHDSKAAISITFRKTPKDTRSNMLKLSINNQQDVGHIG